MKFTQLHFTAMPLHMLETRVNKWIEESNDIVM